MSDFEDIIKQINKDAKETILQRGVEKVRIESIPFSSPCANFITYGGIPLGRMVEFSGPESSGKTTTALDVVSQAQILFYAKYEEEIQIITQRLSKEKLSKTVVNELETRLNWLKKVGPKKIVYVDSENTFDYEWAENLSVDTEAIYLLSPQEQSAEWIFEQIINLVNTGEVGLVILDSIAVLVSAQAMEKSIEDKTYCGVSGPLTVFANKMGQRVRKFGTTLIGINQIRDDLKNQFNLYNTPGGKAWRHHCSVRLEFRQGDYIDEDGKEVKRSEDCPAGNLVNISVKKSKCFRPDRKSGYYTLVYGSGVDIISDTVHTAVTYDLIEKAGAWYYYNEQKFQGLKKLKDYFTENSEDFQSLYEEVNKLVIN